MILSIFHGESFLCMRSNYINIEEKFRYFSDCVADSSETESFFFLDLPEIIL